MKGANQAPLRALKRGLHSGEVGLAHRELSRPVCAIRQKPQLETAGGSGNQSPTHFPLITRLGPKRPVVQPTTLSEGKDERCLHLTLGEAI
jgi:hypothetical protein